MTPPINNEINLSDYALDMSLHLRKKLYEARLVAIETQAKSLGITFLEKTHPASQSVELTEDLKDTFADKRLHFLFVIALACAEFNHIYVKMEDESISDFLFGTIKDIKNGSVAKLLNEMLDYLYSQGICYVHIDMPTIKKNPAWLAIEPLKPNYDNYDLHDFNFVSDILINQWLRDYYTAHYN